MQIAVLLCRPRTKIQVGENRLPGSRAAGLLKTIRPIRAKSRAPAAAQSPMSRSSINLRGLTFLIADSNSFFSSICHGVLRGFGATKVIEVRDASQVVTTLKDYKIDLLLCDAKLPPSNAFQLTHSIRWQVNTDYRTIPILIMASDTRATLVRATRDCGANMMIAKPISPARLYDRLCWVAMTPRKFVDAPTYFGPDRRFKIEGYPSGTGRRKEDSDIEIRESTGPQLSQTEIDNLLKMSRSG
jgi:two-component system chemotaxis response regulator CheY